MSHAILACLLGWATAGAVGGTELPIPSGPYAVGTTRLALVDPARPELFTEDPDDRRRVSIRAWYPGEHDASARVASYLDGAGPLVDRYGYPDALRNLDTCSRWDLPVATDEERYPVVLFNHGWGEHVAQNTILMEELASHGYVVLSLTHHHEAKFWPSATGELEHFDPRGQRMSRIMQEQRSQEAMELFQGMFATRGVAAQEALFRRSVRTLPMFLRQSPRLWAEDISFVVDELTELAPAACLLAGHLDLARLAVMGMSMGGIAAAQAAITDDRIRAVINVDGGLMGDLVDTTIAVPVLYMGSRRFCGYEEVFFAHAVGDAYSLIVPDADHQDFTDCTLIHRDQPLIGSVDGRRMLTIVNRYTLAFLDRHLRGRESALLAGRESPFPEAIFRARRSP